MASQQADTSIPPDAGGNGGAAASNSAAGAGPSSRVVVKSKGKRRPKPILQQGAALAKLPANLSAARRIVASAERLACERCHQEQRPLSPEFMYLWIGRCRFQGLDIYMPYRRLRQDNHVFYAGDHGTCVDITAVKILDGKAVTGPPEEYSRQRGVSFNTIMDSAKNTVRRKLILSNNNHD